MKRLAIFGLILAVTFAFTGCLTFLGFQPAPEYVEDTNILIRENDDESVSYVATIGETETTVFEAVYDGMNQWHFGYRYQDRLKLDAKGLEIHTYCCINSLDSRNPDRRESPDGVIYEADEIPVRKNLFEQIVDSPAPAIYLIGPGGRVVLEFGHSGRRRIQELLDYAEGKRPE